MTFATLINEAIDRNANAFDSFSKIYFLCMIKPLRRDKKILEQAYQRLGLPQETIDFIDLHLTWHGLALQKDLGFSSPEYIAQMKAKDKEFFLPVLCGVTQFLEERRRSSIIVADDRGLKAHIEEFQDYETRKLALFKLFPNTRL